MSQKLWHEAVDWFVLNESGAAEDAEFAQRWEQWHAEPVNWAEYISLLQFAQDLRRLPPPSMASRKDLLQDVAPGDGGSGISRTG